MSIEKAKEFLDHLSKNKELRDKFSGFTFEELKQVSKKMKTKGNLNIDDLDKVSGGGRTHYDISNPIHMDGYRNN